MSTPAPALPTSALSVADSSAPSSVAAFFIPYLGESWLLWVCLVVLVALGSIALYFQGTPLPSSETTDSSTPPKEEALTTAADGAASAASTATSADGTPAAIPPATTEEDKKEGLTTEAAAAGSKPKLASDFNTTSPTSSFTSWSPGNVLSHNVPK